MTTATAEAAIRAQLKSTIQGVSNTGVVHDYLRWAAEYSAFLDLFKTTISGKSVIRGWTITCESMPQRQDGDDGATYGTRATGNIQTFNYRLRFYAGLDDSAATEKTILTLALNVVDALDTATTVIDSTSLIATPAQLEVFEPRMFGSVLCHYAEIVQVVERDT